VKTQNGCGQSALDKDVTFTPNRPPTANAGSDFTKNCSENRNGKAIGAAPESGFSYQWSPATGLSDASISNPIANPWATTTYTLTVTNAATGCTATDDVVVNFNVNILIMPTNTNEIVACIGDVDLPNPPEVKDCFGDFMVPVLDIVPNSTCNGDMVYSWKYTDKAGQIYIWTHTITIKYEPFASIAATSETSECFHYPTLPQVKDNCGNILVPSEPVLTPLQDCEGCMTFTYTYTDCAGNQQDYVHTLCIRRTTLPVEVGAPVSSSSTVELIAGVIPPVPSVLPVVMDVCSKTLTHGEPVIGGTYDGTEGSYSFTYTYTDCPGLKFVWTYTYTVVPAVVIPSGETQLSYRFANPRIANNGSGDYFEFDVQVKANVGSTAFLKGNVNLDMNITTLSSNEMDWIVTPISGYSSDLSILGTNLNVALETLDSGTEITTAYQNLITLKGKIMDNTGIAGIDFNEGNMNGQQSYKLLADPWFAAYYNPNAYDKSDFIDTYVGRIFATTSGWTQTGGLAWDKLKNTSVWEGNATVPGGTDVSTAAKLRIHKPATLTIPDNGKLTVIGNTEIKSPIGLRIESDGSGTGSLITETASGAGAMVAQRYMTTGAWHFVTSSVTGQSISNFLNSNLNIATDVDADIYASDAMRGMMDYNPDLKGWNDYFNNSTAGNLETGKGFSIRTNAASAVNFRGNLQAGNLTASGLVAEKWNCIGNPYTSAIGITMGVVASFLIS